MNPFDSSQLRKHVRGPVNHLLGTLGVRVVNARWGPSGFQASFRRLKDLGLAPEAIVDVGASDGMWTRECLEIFPDANYFLVDPLEENVGPLRQLAQEQSRVKVWRGALGREHRRLSLTVHGDQSSFFASEYDRGITRSVEVRPLDSFLGSELLRPPDLLKADVQGFELEVLRGAARCLETAQWLLLEVSFRQIYKDSPLAHEVIAFAGSRGFRILDICTYTQRPSGGGLAHADLLFAREGSAIFTHE